MSYTSQICGSLQDNKHRPNIDISPFRMWFVCLLEKNNVTTNFLMLVLKWLKINCLMLYSQKNKCLVLSKYPHSDPQVKLEIQVQWLGKSRYLWNLFVHQSHIQPLKMHQSSKQRKINSSERSSGEHSSILEFWIIVLEGRLLLSPNNNVCYANDQKRGPKIIKVLCEQTRELTLDFLDYI